MGARVVSGICVQQVARWASVRGRETRTRTWPSRNRYNQDYDARNYGGGRSSRCHWGQTPEGWL